MKIFLENLKRELQAVKIREDIIHDIIEDHKEMIEAARAEGISDNEIKNHIGNPKKIAEDIAAFEEKNQYLVRDNSGEKNYIFDVDVDEIEVYTNLVSEDTVYQNVDADQIKIEVIGDGDLSKYDISFINGRLKVETYKHKGFSFGFSFAKTPKLIVSIPNKLIIKSLVHNSVDAKLNFNQLNLKEVFVKTIDGDVIFEKIKSDSLKVSSVNGNLSFDDLKLNNMIISTVSGSTKIVKVDLELDLVTSSIDGELEIKHTSAQNLSIHTVSGDVTITEVDIRQEFNVESTDGNLKTQDSKSDTFDFCTISGYVDAKEFYPKKVSLNSMSGSINILNTKNESIEVVKQKSLSGEINIR